MLRAAIWTMLAVSLGSATSWAQVHLATHHQMGMDDGEITPDERLAVVRENTAQTTARVYDMATGALRSQVMAAIGTFSGACQDAVAVTNTRAVVIGSSAMILDLTNLTNPLLGEHLIGFEARDVAITPDGTLAIVRGGRTLTGYPGGLFVFDLATGAQLASHPGEVGVATSTTHTYDVDSVVTTNGRAVCTSIVTPGPAARTRVAIWDLHPAGGGPPVVSYETASFGAELDQAGAPHDLALTPDGQYAAVRSELSVGLYYLGGATPTRVWHKRLWNHPGPMGFTSMDSIEATNTRIATASRWQSGTSYGAQLDVFDLAGNQWVERMRGDPHDLVITPDGTRLAVRTHIAVYLYDIANLPGGLRIEPIAKRELLSTHTFYGAGYDSLQCTNERLVAVARLNVSAIIETYDIRSGALQVVAQSSLPEKPVDVDLSPNGRWLGVTGTSYVQLYDFETNTLLLSHDPSIDFVGWFPWCDGVEVSDHYALAWGYDDSQGGWDSLFALLPQAVNYCTTSPNSTGVGATIHATGTSSIARNDLDLWATHLPSGANGYFVYANGQGSTPLGNGTLCVSGLRYFMPMVNSAGSVAAQSVDYLGSTALGGAITAGTTWNFQFRYRDPGAAGAQYNLSDGLSVSFVN